MMGTCQFTGMQNGYPRHSAEMSVTISFSGDRVVLVSIG